MGIKVTQFEFTPDQQQRMLGLVPESGWALLSSTNLNGILPDAYVAKVDSVVALSAPTSSGGTCLMFNNLRVDHRTRLIDQDPLGMFVTSTDQGASGVLVHHGDWDNRSWETSSGLWSDVEESGVGGFFLTHPPANRLRGALTDLPKGSTGALDRVLAALRDRSGGSG